MYPKPTTTVEVETEWRLQPLAPDEVAQLLQLLFATPSDTSADRSKTQAAPRPGVPV